MKRQFTLEYWLALEYWLDGGWYVGKLKEIPSVSSQGETLEELEDNIKDTYALVVGDRNTSLRFDYEDPAHYTRRATGHP